MRKSTINENTLKKALMIRAMVEAHYEPGRQDRNRRWVFRHVVLKVYPISERTFWRYMTLTRNITRKPEPDDPNQLKLF